MKFKEKLHQFGILVIRAIWPDGSQNELPRAGSIWRPNWLGTTFFSFLDSMSIEKMGRINVREGGHVSAKNKTTGEKKFMSVLSRSYRTFVVRFISISLMIGLVLFLALNASAGTSFVDSVASFLGFAGETEAFSKPAPAPAGQMFIAGTCDTAGPIEVEGSILGTTPTAYATLTAAFAAINGGTHTGAITIDVCGDTDEGTGTALLNESGSGSASYSSISMSPAGGAARTISGATTAGNPMIDLSGADNVTINGLNTGGNSLTISNTTSPGTSGTSTIRFIGGATNNTISNSTILGSKGTSVATNGGNIFFSTDGVTPNGNDNNTISNNNIGPAGPNLPSTAIQCNGSTTTTAKGNSGIIINNNNIYDYFAAAVTSSGVAVNGGCNTMSVTNNRFYQTGTRTWTTGATHRAIDLNSSTTVSGVQGMTVTGNTIGYASNTQTGTYTLTGSTGKFQGLFYNGISGSALSTINNNTIASVSLSGVTSSGTSSTLTNIPMAGILITLGNTTVNNNTIGSQTATGSLTYSTTTTSASEIYAIITNSVDVFTSNNNSIGGITSTNGGTGGIFNFGMRVINLTTTAWNASGNMIGGTVADSIQSSATNTTSQSMGMIANPGPMILSGNVIRNMTVNSGTGTGIAASLFGIIGFSPVPNHNYSQNQVYNLKNTNATATSVVTGIYFQGGAASVVERNLIYGLSVSTNRRHGS